MLENYQNYGPYAECVRNKHFEVNASDIHFDNWNDHFYGILNILKDGIETPFVQSTFVTVHFPQTTIELSIMDYFFNVFMWHLIVSTDQAIEPKHLFFDEAITRKTIKRYIDKFFISENRKKLPNIQMNNIIDETLCHFAEVDNFALYLANTINLEDNIMLMNKVPEFYNLIHADLANIPLEDVKNVGMEKTNKAIHYMKNAKSILGFDHCLADSLRANEGINPKQLKEFVVNIGSKPNGQGGVYPNIINKSFITGGVNDILSYFIESSTGRIAQIMSKKNVGESGHFARLLGLNNTDTFLHPDPHYACDSKNFQILYIANKDMLEKVRDRYYRFNPDGLEYLVSANDTQLIGQSIYLRSPMTCSSHSRGEGICYKCYGDLAYTNRDINIGKIAAEEISSKLTQILLSAKHLLETIIEKIEWSEKFQNFFEVEGNIVKLLSDTNFKGCFIEIDPESIEMENEVDFDKNEYSEYEEDGGSTPTESYNEYITEFSVIAHNKEKFPISSKDNDKRLYISNELNDVIRRRGKPVDGKIHISMTDLEDCPLFFIPIENNELSRTMNNIMNIINRNSEVKTRNRHQWLQEFINAIIEGNLDIQAVHCEVILMNQMRNIDNVLELPEWWYQNEPCNILTLNQALTDNPSVSISLLYQRLSKQLYNPLTFRKGKPSFMDLFFMETPQLYLNSNDIKPAVDDKIEKNFVNPIIHYPKETEE